MATNGRDGQGRFAEGNPGGPGRPRRAVEREYLARMMDSITLDDWGDIVARAVADAKDGDKAARDWLARYVLGESPMTLTELAKREALGVEAEHEVAAGVDMELHPPAGDWAAALSTESVLDRARRIAREQEAARSKAARKARRAEA